MVADRDQDRIGFCKSINPWIIFYFPYPLMVASAFKRNNQPELPEVTFTLFAIKLHPYTK